MSSDSVSSKLEAAYDMFRRLPPRDLERNLDFVSEILDDEDAEDLLQTVSGPLKVQTSPSGSFIESDYNRDGDSFRCPIDNRYYPSAPAGFRPPSRLRQLEIACNQIFSHYTQQYYGKDSAFCSCYFFGIERGFAASVLIHKDVGSSHAPDLVDAGVWDSIHVVSVEENEEVAKYSLCTTVIITMKNGLLDLSGIVEKKMERVLPHGGGSLHIVNIGNMVQDMENGLRHELRLTYFDKARQVTHALRERQKRNDALMFDLARSIGARRRRREGIV